MNLSFLKPLPDYLIQRYNGWKATTFSNNKSWYHKLAEDGQHPRAMIISCCDSRVHVTSIFGSDAGEFFIHRNIANLIPPYKPDGDHHGTSAAVEYGVTTLEVSHLIVLGHSNCGGINGGYHLCKGTENQQKSIFVHKWLSILEPAYKNISKEGSDEMQIMSLEKESIKISINNLIEFPFIKESLEKDKLVIHGLWHDIASGELEMLDPSNSNFVKI